MNRRLEAYMSRRGAWVEAELSRLIARDGRSPISFLEPMPKPIRKAMGYSLMAGGKRLRPILVMAAAETCGLPPRRALGAACALEMVHTYSLIHDDLPAMDDDDLRRGKPTSHKVFGEALAILAGDALLTYAFELAAENALRVGLKGRDSAELIRVIAAGAGARGMVGGQVADIEAEGFSRGSLRKDPARARRLLDYIHIHKTAALIAASLEAGAVLAGASDSRRAALREYGRATGLAFQIADDILDRVGDKRKLGKRGSDVANDKLTFVRLYGLEKSRAKAAELAARAHLSLSPFGRAAQPLHDLADYFVQRDR